MSRWPIALVLACTACGDLIPKRPEVTAESDTTVATEVDASVPDGVSCSSDEECLPYAGCCLAPRCISGTCLPTYVPSCCIEAGPCATSSKFHDGTCVAACEANGCVEALDPGTGSCASTIWTQAFDDAGVDALTFEDADPADRVGWALSEQRTFEGRATLYAGDIACPTYYDGPLGADCHALGPGDAGPIELTFTSAPLLLPEQQLAIAQLWLWIDVGEGHVDGVTVSVTRDSYVSRPLWDSRTADVPRGEWLPVLVDLAEHAGKVVRLVVTFDTYDGRDNDHEGVYVGAMEVRTVCDDDLACPAPAPCAVGRQVAVAPYDSTACVVAPADPQIACVECTGPETCPRGDSCDVAHCDGGVCSVTHELTAECCTPEPDWPGDPSFEGALEEGWEADEGWAGSAIRSFVGERALHFGLDDGSGIAAPGMSAEGVVWTSPIRVPADAPVWSFALYLDTEWNDAPSSENPAGLDLFEALVMPAATIDLPSVTVWDSRALGGTTQGQWERVRVALDPFAGRNVRLGFRFRTGDEHANEGEGAFVDDARVFRACPGCGRDVVAPGCDPGSETP